MSFWEDCIMHEKILRHTVDRYVKIKLVLILLMQINKIVYRSTNLDFTRNSSTKNANISSYI